jgi:hypothetical protein
METTIEQLQAQDRLIEGVLKLTDMNRQLLQRIAENEQQLVSQARVALHQEEVLRRQQATIAALAELVAEHDQKLGGKPIVKAKPIDVN